MSGEAGGLRMLRRFEVRHILPAGTFSGGAVLLDEVRSGVVVAVGDLDSVLAAGNKERGRERVCLG